MKIENFCCVAAELQNKMTGTTKMSQIYYYRAYEEETLEEMLTTGFFNAIQDRVKKDDMILLYEPNTNDTPQMTWVKVVSNIGGVVTISEINPPAPAQEQADWTEADSTAVSYIKNKPSAGVGISLANNTISIDADSSPIEDSAKPITSGAVYTALSNKQDTLVSGTNIKTINNNSILGSGDLQIDSLPSQTGHAGEYLTTDGTDASWEAISSTYHPTLFAFQWSDCLKNDVQWLRADTFSWQSGTVYEAAYEHLVDDIDGKTAQTETIGSYTITYYEADDGHKIVLADQETTVQSIYAESGVAWYYILDTANTRFKLPRGSHGEVVEKYQSGNSWYRVYSDGWCEQGGAATTSSVTLLKEYSNTQYNVSMTQTGGSAYTAQPQNKTTTGFTYYNYQTTYLAEWRTCGYISTPPANSQYKHLYFYVGSFTQTALENTAGLNAELFNGKIDLDLGNATQATKETIIGWSMPDYSAGVSQTSGTAYTAQSNGYIKWGVSIANNQEGSIDINGSTFARMRAGNPTGLQPTDGFMIPIIKGTTYQGNNVSMLIFYPCLGA